jgi:hypothetical protein
MAHVVRRRKRGETDRTVFFQNYVLPWVLAYSEKYPYMSPENLLPYVSQHSVLQGRGPLSLRQIERAFAALSFTPKKVCTPCFHGAHYVFAEDVENCTPC